MSSKKKSPAPKSAIEPRRELWRFAAWILFVLFVLGYFYLGQRPGGSLPLFVFGPGRFLLALAALVVLFWGAATCLLRRPVFQPGRVRAFLAVAVVFGFVNVPFPFPAPREGRPSAVEFRLPFDGEWQVFWGGSTTETNRLAAFYADQRFGFHFVRVEEGAHHRGTGASNKEHFAFRKELYAPAAGRVVAASDGAPDVEPGERLAQGAVPNQLVIEVSEGEFLFLSPLAQGSLQVQVGDEVARGQIVGLVGHDGSSPATPFPHLSVHLQDTAETRAGAGIPLLFYDLTVDGAARESALPSGGIDDAGDPVGALVRTGR